ncbi:D-Ala-D-Ala carboxypeptidase family metallohydrolase [Asticcacaulis tiandongensis]|uniref:D-Ala-D-Ala carboxypeptidase family metallohydrolase n=1 Tax=Asticcacaulis tiandongensis TaxID=2565365 RepID=UPI00112724C1|nr:D-Ala-D-Ala carboxypeptidase family metallohydrolase [Asticcacaulis tiandongensis]
MWSAEFFTLEEMTRSDTARARGIDNVPKGQLLTRLNATAKRMDSVRLYLGHPVIVTSGYRSAALNHAVGGASSSHHVQAYAVDFRCPAFGDPVRICSALRDSGIRYDQLIQEFNQWVHISFAPTLRQQTLTAFKQDGKHGGRTVYRAGLG